MQYFHAHKVNSGLDAEDSGQNSSPEVKEAAVNIHGHAVGAEKGASGDASGSADKEAQAGVQQAEAITIIWTRKSLILTYAL